MFTFVRHYMNFILSKNSVYIKVVLQNILHTVSVLTKLFLLSIYLKSMQLVTITVKKSSGGSRFDYATYWVFTVKVVT